MHALINERITDLCSALDMKVIDVQEVARFVNGCKNDELIIDHQIQKASFANVDESSDGWMACGLAWSVLSH